MKTTFSRITAVALPGFFALLVIFATTAEAGGAKSLDPTAMGQSIRAQLEGTDYQFAIAKHGRLDLTGSHGHPSPNGAVAELRTGQTGGDSTMCHLSDNGVEAVVIVTNPSAALPQPCGVLGAAMEAAA